MKSKILLLFLQVFYLVSCTSNSKNSEKIYEGVHDSNHIGFWFREKDSIDHNLTEVANVVWSFGRADSVDIYDLETILNWQRECEAVMSHCFDSIHPNSSLTTFEKADSMATILSNFITEGEETFTPISRMVVWDTENSFSRYKGASACKKLIDANPNFEKEIKAYNAFCSKFIDILVTIGRRWGGSYSGPKSVSLSSQIENARLKDLSDLSIFSTCTNENDIYFKV